MIKNVNFIEIISPYSNLVHILSSCVGCGTLAGLFVFLLFVPLFVLFTKFFIIVISLIVFITVIIVLFLGLGRSYFRIDQEQITLTWKTFFRDYHDPSPAPRQCIHKLIYKPTQLKKSFQRYEKIPPQLIIKAGLDEYNIYHHLYHSFHFESITDPEIEWLAQELSNWLDLPITQEPK